MQQIKRTDSATKQVKKHTENINAYLTRIREQVAGYSKVDTLHYGHAGDLAHIENLLKEIADAK